MLLLLLLLSYRYPIGSIFVRYRSTDKFLWINIYTWTLWFYLFSMLLALFAWFPARRNNSTRKQIHVNILDYKVYANRRILFVNFCHARKWYDFSRIEIRRVPRTLVHWQNIGWIRIFSTIGTRTRCRHSSSNTRLTWKSAIFCAYGMHEVAEQHRHVEKLKNIMTHSSEALPRQWKASTKNKKKIIVTNT